MNTTTPAQPNTRRPYRGARVSFDWEPNSETNTFERETNTETNTVKREANTLGETNMGLKRPLETNTPSRSQPNTGPGKHRPSHSLSSASLLPKSPRGRREPWQRTAQPGKTEK